MRVVYVTKGGGHADLLGPAVRLGRQVLGRLEALADREVRANLVDRDDRDLKETQESRAPGRGATTGSPRAHRPMNPVWASRNRHEAIASRCVSSS